MYCSTCGGLINTELNYCNRCGARVDKLATVENSSATGYLSMATGFVGLGGLGLTVGLIAILLKNAVVIEAVVMLAIAFLATVFGMTFMMIRQISQMSNVALPAKERAIENPQLNQPRTAQLEEPRQPARSVTENTTRTLEKELIK
jgi:uncharacterized membrane-anchored protein